MDGGRFDELTRAVGRGTSRRKLLGLLIGGTAVVTRGAMPVAAQQCKTENSVCDGPGQCCAGLRCFWFQGAGTCLTTCWNEGSGCRWSEECCDGLPCESGFCGGVDCGQLFDQCSVNGDCCSGSNLVCHAGQCLLSCGEEDVGCDRAAQCCEGLVCDTAGANTCRRQCAGQGVLCERGIDGCCAGLTCDSNNFCEPCIDAFETCTGPGECCVGLRCITFVEGTACSPSCSSAGVQCSWDEECCGELECDVSETGSLTCGGIRCDPLEDCGPGGTCCTGLICTNGKCLLPCAGQNIPCAFGITCCEGLQCIDDRCQSETTTTTTTSTTTTTTTLTPVTTTPGPTTPPPTTTTSTPTTPPPATTTPPPTTPPPATTTPAPTTSPPAIEPPASVGLPDTGVGPANDGGASPGWTALGAALAAGAAAFLTRQAKEQQEEPEAHDAE